jgi:hypothetical protein
MKTSRPGRRDASRASRSDASTTSTSDASPRRRPRRVRKNPLLGSPFVRTNPLADWRPRRNPLIASPTFRPAVEHDEQLVAENPSAWSRAMTRVLETAGGSLGGFGWNYLAGQTLRSMNIESQNVNDVIGYFAAAAPALAFATFLAGDGDWRPALAGASLYDFWLSLAVKVGIGQREPSPPAGTT